MICIGIMYVGLYQAVAAVNKDLPVMCSRYQVCGIMTSSGSSKEGLADDL